MRPLLEILIPYSEEHILYASDLELEFMGQRTMLGVGSYSKVKITTCPDIFGNRGMIRNYMLQSSVGEYVVFFDADDKPASDYIRRTLKALETKPDCCSLTGVITWDGEKAEVFEHSLKYDAYKTNDTGEVKYERYPNHLNAIKADIAKQFKFPEIDFGEDTDWATQIFKSGLLKNEVKIEGVIYHYQYKSKKP